MGLFPWAQILRPGLRMTIWCGSPPGGRACSCLVGPVPEQGNADVLRALVILRGTKDLVKPRDCSSLGTDSSPWAQNDKQVRPRRVRMRLSSAGMVTSSLSLTQCATPSHSTPNSFPLPPHEFVWLTIGRVQGRLRVSCA
ncbi:MAG: hypothetical protein OEM58_12605, partial [Nitrospirota bacterium]|nr:hypothetical protein [Nitrospirota bacterium]